MSPSLLSQIILGIKWISLTVGIILNFLVLLVRAVRFFQKYKISSFHLIIVQLAVCDVIYAVFLSFSIEQVQHGFFWVRSEKMCKLVTFVHFVTSSLPGLLISLLAFERYRGIKNTLIRRTIRKTFCVTTVMWIFTMGIYAPDYWMAHTEYFQPGNGTTNGTVCLPNRSLISDEIYEIYVCAKTFIYFAIPMVLTIVLHGKIYYYVRRETSRMSTFIDTIKGSPEVQKNIVDGNGDEDKNMIENKDNMHHFNKYSVPSFKHSVQIMFQKSQYLHKRISATFGITKRKQKYTSRLKVRILMMITLCFFICVFPFYLWQLLIVLDVIHLGTKRVYINIGLVLSFLLDLHCFVNGIIYSFLDTKFRHDIKLIIKSVFLFKTFSRLEVEEKYKQRISFEYNISQK